MKFRKPIGLTAKVQIFLRIQVLVMAVCLCITIPLIAKETEIRVIVPKYVNKSGKFDLGLDVGLVTNQSYLYTYLLTARVGYHFNEFVAVKGFYGVGTSLVTDDYRILEAQSQENKMPKKTEGTYGADLELTLFYGKYNAVDSGIYYFDTVVGLGYGGVSVAHSLRCLGQDEVRLVNYPANFVKLNHKVYTNQSRSFDLSISQQRYSYDEADTLCRDDLRDEQIAKYRSNILISIGNTWLIE